MFHLFHRRTTTNSSTQSASTSDTDGVYENARMQRSPSAPMVSSGASASAAPASPLSLAASAPSSPLSASEKSQNIQVCVRARPLLPHEHNQPDGGWEFSEKQIVARDGKSWTFDHVFGPDATNEATYREKVLPVVNSFMEGFNGTILAYGQSGSGKTYTLLGPSETFEEGGLLQIAVADICQRIQTARENGTMNYMLKVQPIEVYMEKAQQLLHPLSELKMFYNNNQGLAHDKLPVVSSPDEIIDVLRESLALRKQGVSNYNDRSSRSHFIFRLVLLAAPDVSDNASISRLTQTQSELLFVDLAGSERMLSDDVAQQKQLSGRDVAMHRKEGNCINGSLLALHDVIDMLLKGERFIPYNRHILTKILQNSLGGNSKTTVICTVATALKDYDFTKNTLTFGSKTRTIQNSVSKNVASALSPEERKMFQKLQEDALNLKKSLAALEEENRNLRNQNALIRARNKILVLQCDNMDEKEKAQHIRDNTYAEDEAAMVAASVIEEEEWQREVDRVFAYETRLSVSGDTAGHQPLNTTDGATVPSLITAVADVTITGGSASDPNGEGSGEGCVENSLNENEPVTIAPPVSPAPVSYCAPPVSPIPMPTTPTAFTTPKSSPLIKANLASSFSPSSVYEEQILATGASNSITHTPVSKSIIPSPETVVASGVFDLWAPFGGNRDSGADMDSGPAPKEVELDEMSVAEDPKSSFRNFPPGLIPVRPLSVTLPPRPVSLPPTLLYPSTSLSVPIAIPLPDTLESVDQTQLFDKELPPEVPRLPRLTLEDFENGTKLKELQLQAEELKVTNKVVQREKEQLKDNHERRSFSKDGRRLSDHTNGGGNPHDNSKSKNPIMRFFSQFRGHSATPPPLQHSSSHLSLRSHASTASSASKSFSRHQRSNSNSSNASSIRGKRFSSMDGHLKEDNEKLQSQLAKQQRKLEELTARENNFKSNMEKLREQLKADKHKMDEAEKKMKEKDKLYKRSQETEGKLLAEVAALKKRNKELEQQSKAKEALLANEMKILAARVHQQEQQLHESEKKLQAQAAVSKKEHENQMRFLMEIEHLQKELNEYKKYAHKKEHDMEVVMEKQKHELESSHKLLEVLKDKLEHVKH